MTAPALTLHRARSAAPFASRGALAAALDWWREEPGNEGEWLLVPRLRLVAPPAAHSSPTALARQLNRALGAVREAATVDPAPGSWPPGALRFTRPERWLAWLAVRLATPDDLVSRECAPLPEAPAVLRAQLRGTVAREPRVLLALVRTLRAAGEFKAWAESWSPADVAAIGGALTAHFAVAPQILAILLADAPSTPANKSSQLPALFSPGADLASAALQPNQSQAHAAARRIMAASEPLPGLAALEPQRQALARLLIVLPAAPALAPQLAQVLAAELVEPAPAAPLDVTPPEPQLTIRPHQATPDQQTESSSPVRTVPDQVVTPTPHTALPGASHRDLEVPANLHSALPDVSEPSHQASPIPQHPNTPARRSELPPIAQPALFETQFGGLLFLLNAFTALDLYPDFTRPLDPRLEPSPCWLLGRIGQLWFGRRFARDPLAEWLALRAVGGKFPSEWRISPEWEPAALRPLRFQHRGSACEWDRRGFLAKAAPLRPHDRHLPGPSLKLARTLRRLPLQAEPWLAGFLSYLDWRLTQAELHRTDLCLAAQLHWQDDCASLRLPLAQLPIALRLAGLDRDPGWLPAEGCNFRFEFA
jgi:hypothetical protein